MSPLAVCRRDAVFHHCLCRRRGGVVETRPSSPLLSSHSVSAAALRKCCTATPLLKHCSHLLSFQLTCHVDFMVVFVPGNAKHLQARQVFRAATQINVCVFSVQDLCTKRRVGFSVCLPLSGCVIDVTLM